MHSIKTEDKPPFHEEDPMPIVDLRLSYRFFVKHSLYTYAYPKI